MDVSAVSQQVKDSCWAIKEENSAKWATAPPEAAAKMKAAVADKAARDAENAKLWQEADKDGDGLLNEEEFCAFIKAKHELAEKDWGWSAPYDEAFAKKIYSTMGTNFPHPSGYMSPDAMKSFYAVVGAVAQEKAAAAQ